MPGLFGQTYDIAVIGGGINGCAIARDAAGRGLSVFLCEQADLGAGASSASLKMVHGGLRFLERLQLGQLRASLGEQEILMRAAPHLVRPHRFIIPYHAGLWPRWALDLGLHVYDRASTRSLPRHRKLELERNPVAAPLHRHFDLGFEYSDCIADDSRLVIANAIDARAQGAVIQPRLTCVIAEREGKLWRLALENSETGERLTVLAKVLVNATGAWLTDVLNHVIHTDQRVRLRFVKESHIILRRKLPDGHAFVLPNADGRIVYALPLEGDFTIVGSTRNGYAGGQTASVDDREAAYLAEVANQYFQAPIQRNEVAYRYAGVRVLTEDGGAPAREAKRDHVVVVNAPPRGAPLVSIYGGTITTHRRVAELVVERIRRFFGAARPWTAAASLPGGNFPRDGAADIVRALRAAYPFIELSHAVRMVRAYGTRAPMVLTGARGREDLGRTFGEDLTEAEVTYLMTEEWARTAEDVLWRRGKLGLRFKPGEVEALADWMTSVRNAAFPAPESRVRNRAV